MNYVVKIAIFALVSFIYLPIALAADTVTTGKIAQILSVASPGGAPGNADERVYLAGFPRLCPGATDPAWAYINVSDPNFKGVLANLLFAYGAGKTVQIYAAPTSISGGTYCQISYIVVMD